MDLSTNYSKTLPTLRNSGLFLVMKLIAKSIE